MPYKHDLEKGNKLRKILIIGSNGYIGSELYMHLKNNGFDIFGIDNYLRSESSTEPKETVNKVIGYQELTSDFLDKYDDIVWVAGHSNVRVCIDNPQDAIKNNLYDLIEFTSSLSDKHRFIYASSGSIYSSDGNRVNIESDSTFLPQNTYDFTKIAFDGYVNSHNIKAITLRFATVNGFSQRIRSELMINSMVKSAKSNNFIQLCNAEYKRPILALKDLCRGIESILRSDRNHGIYNLCSFNSPIGKIAEKVAEELNTEIKIIPDTPTYNFLISAEKFEKDFSFKFNQSIQDIIKELYENEY